MISDSLFSECRQLLQWCLCWNFAVIEPYWGWCQQWHVQAGGSSIFISIHKSYTENKDIYEDIVHLTALFLFLCSWIKLLPKLCRRSNPSWSAHAILVILLNDMQDASANVRVVNTTKSNHIQTTAASFYSFEKTNYCQSHKQNHTSKRINHLIFPIVTLQLQEVEVGSTLPRTLCGKLYTSLRQEPANDGSGNLKFGNSYPLVIPESQICVTPASDEQTIGFIESVQQELIQVCPKSDCQ